MNDVPNITRVLFLTTVFTTALLLPWGLYKASLNRGKSSSLSVPFTAAAALMIWMATTAWLAQSGKLGFPPENLTTALMLLTSFALTFALAFSPWGTQLAQGHGLPLLIGFQIFRIPVEMVLHQLYLAGISPVQMSYSGMNFDILTGISAPIVAYLVWKKHIASGGVLLWNILGLGLLITIVTIAILSMPTPLRLFTQDPANTFVTQFPFVWLPTILVQAALLGHLLVFRKLKCMSQTQTI